MLKTIIEFFDGLGWLVNAISIGGILLGLFGFLSKYPWLLGLRKKDNLTREIQVVANLPERTENFIGRQLELSEAKRLLRPGKTLTICGAGGVGKTAFARELIHLIFIDKARASFFRGGVVEHSFYLESSTEIAISAIASSLGFVGGQHHYLVRAIKSHVSQNNTIVFLDGIELCEDVDFFIGLFSGAAILLTSRDRYKATSERIDLDALSDKEAHHLLLAWGKEKTRSPSIAREICSLVENFPLAIKLIGHYLSATDISAEQYLEWLRESPLEALNHGKRSSQSVVVVIKKSIDFLDEGCVVLLRIFGAFGDVPLSISLVCQVSGLDQIQANVLLSKISRFFILRQRNDGWIPSHALIHAYLRKSILDDFEIISKCIKGMKKFLEGSSGRSYTLFEARKIYKHFIEISGVLLEQKRFEDCIDLMNSGFERCLGCGYLPELENLFLKAVHDIEFKDLGNDVRRKILGGLINLYNSSNRAADAARLLWEMLHLADNQLDIARDYINLGIAHSEMKNYLRAKRYNEEAINILKSLNRDGKLSGEIIRVEANQAVVLREIGDLDQSLQVSNRLLAEHDAIVGDGIKKSKAVVLANLGRLYSNDNFSGIDFEISGVYFQGAAEIFLNNQDYVEAALDLEMAGYMFRNAKRLSDAHRNVQSARDIYREIGNSIKESRLDQVLSELESELSESQQICEPPPD